MSVYNRIVAIDGIRGLAVILILIWHFGNNALANNGSKLANYFKLITTYCWSGVDLFFVLSGFLLGGILLKNKNSPYYFKTFYFRRICRIFPLYFLVLTLIFLLILPNVESSSWSHETPIPNWTYFAFCQNIFMGLEATLGNKWLTHTWSLGLEEQFYIILPLIIYFLPKRALIGLLVICSLLAPYFRYQSNNWFEAFNFLHCRFDALFVGVLAAILIQSEVFSNWLRKKGLLLLCLLFIGILVILLMSANLISIYSYLENSVFAITYALLIIIIAGGTSPQLNKLFETKLLVKTGLISYCLYLVHQPINGLLHHLIYSSSPMINTFEQLFITILSLSISVLISIASFNYFERHFLKVGHKAHY